MVCGLMAQVPSAVGEGGWGGGCIKREKQQKTNEGKRKEGNKITHTKTHEDPDQENEVNKKFITWL